MPVSPVYEGNHRPNQRRIGFSDLETESLGEALAGLRQTNANAIPIRGTAECRQVHVVLLQAHTNG